MRRRGSRAARFRAIVSRPDIGSIPVSVSVQVPSSFGAMVPASAVWLNSQLEVCSSGMPAGLCERDPMANPPAPNTTAMRTATIQDVFDIAAS